MTREETADAIRYEIARLSTALVNEDDIALDEIIISLRAKLSNLEDYL